MSIHVVPLNDEHLHELTLTCDCQALVEFLDPATSLPWASGLGPRVIHFAFDSRETAEEFLSCACGGWKIVDEEGQSFERGNQN